MLQQNWNSDGDDEMFGCLCISAIHRADYGCITTAEISQTIAVLMQSMLTSILHVSAADVTVQNYVSSFTLSLCPG